MIGVLKSAYRLYKKGFVDSQFVTTVILATPGMTQNMDMTAMDKIFISNSIMNFNKTKDWALVHERELFVF